jgi:HlyD family secretion protein
VHYKQILVLDKLGWFSVLRFLDIRRAKADVKSAQAEVAYTKKELQRLQSLVKKKLTSKESVDRARSEYIAAREKMHALQEQLDLAVIGPRKEDIAAAQAILKANEAGSQFYGFYCFRGEFSGG